MVLKRSSARSYTLSDMAQARGHTIVQFDGGAAGGSGTGGTLLWGAQGQLLAAWAWRFGGDAPTNNAAELEALHCALLQLKELALSK